MLRNLNYNLIFPYERRSTREQISFKNNTTLLIFKNMFLKIKSVVLFLKLNYNLPVGEEDCVDIIVLISLQQH